MNYTSNVNPRTKGKMVWKRNVNTSQTNRKPPSANPKKTRLTSESSDYSYFPETQKNFKLNTTIHHPQNNLGGEWSQIKSMAKHSTIASRMELKKSVPISFLEKSSKKSEKMDKSRVSSRNKSFSRVIDTNGNITNSFKQSSEFKSINPHIPKDVDKIRKKTFNLYKKEKRLMDEFLGEDSETVTMATQNEERVNSRAKSLLMNYNRDPSMQKISERQEYESRLNSTRMKKEKINEGGQNVVIENEMKPNDDKKVKQLSQQAQRYVEEQPIKGFMKSRQKSVYEHIANKKQKSGLSQSSENKHQSNVLLKGLLGEYSNYERMSKHELIQKLISLEYLAQNIFKKNKHLEQQLQNLKLYGKGQSPEKEQFRENSSMNDTFTQNYYQATNVKSKQVQKSERKLEDSKLKSSSSNRNLFVIDNEDGYFNEFLESEKGKDNYEVSVDYRESPERFRETK